MTGWERTRTALAMTLSELGWGLNSSSRELGICYWQPSIGRVTFCDHELSLVEVSRKAGCHLGVAIAHIAF